MLAHTAHNSTPRDRALAVAALVAISLGGWIYLLTLQRSMAADHSAMDGMVMMPIFEPWSGADAVFGFVMWAAMMAAMMTPSAAPLVLMYTRVRRGRQPQATALIAGYLVVWTGFSILAAMAQWALHDVGLLGAGDRVAPILGGVLFMVAGTWQLTPLKHACLTRCRSPMDFLVTHWRDGTTGAVRMGVHHGAWCLGCCWALMLVLFAAGVMNLLWVALLGGWVLLEKALPAGRSLAYAGGVAAIALGAWRVVTAVI